MVRDAEALLLDIGGVVLLSGVELVRTLGEREPSVRVLSDRLGGIGSPRDEMWQQMLRREVTERDYWADRAPRLGDALGERWDLRAMIERLYDAPSSQWLRADALTLMTDTKAAGRRLGALTNDMRSFHGSEWVARQTFLEPFDVIVDAADTGVLKPDAGAYKFAIEALDLPPERIVFLDDMSWNIDGAHDAGMLTVQVHYDDPGAAFAQARAYLGLDRGV